MATTLFKRDHLLRRLVAPTSASTDSLGRVTTSTVDYLGRSLVATAWSATAAVLNEYRMTVGNIVYKCTVAGTPVVGEPTAPGVGSTVVSGTATFRQETTN